MTEDNFRRSSNGMPISYLPSVPMAVCCPRRKLRRVDILLNVFSMCTCVSYCSCGIKPRSEPDRFRTIIRSCSSPRASFTAGSRELSPPLIVPNSKITRLPSCQCRGQSFPSLLKCVCVFAREDGDNHAELEAACHQCHQGRVHSTPVPS